VHHRGHNWAFHYDGMEDEDEEPIFKFDRHRFVPGEYVSITEHDEVQRTFLVTEVIPNYWAASRGELDPAQCWKATDVDIVICRR
jgi:hypothetical protein